MDLVGAFAWRLQLRLELAVEGVKRGPVSQVLLRGRDKGVLVVAVLVAEGSARVLFPVDTATTPISPNRCVGSA